MIANDTPIATPIDDHFGIDPFAQTLAKAISQMRAPEGVVIGVNGPWGSGKSSVLNLILYHLKDDVESERIKIVRFNPWWISGTQAIATAFLEDLLSAIGPSTGDVALKLFRRVAQRVSGFSKIAEAAANTVMPGAGAFAGGAFQMLDKIVPSEEGIEAQHAKVSELLAKSECCFLVVIDDIDRLGPDEAIEVFKLVKSVGQLSNVIYLLAFDRQLAEKVVSERFPSEGPHYLEKILQAAFEVPPASEAQLRSAFLAQVDEVCPPKEDEDRVRFMNVMLEGVTPLLKSPRHINRLLGMLRVTWAAISDEVERADFTTMEALRLFKPDLYRAIRSNPHRLTGYTSLSAGMNRRDDSSEYDEIFLSSIPEKEKPQVKRILRRLFPKLDSVWSNVFHQSDSSAQRFRRVCALEHFDTYFRFSLAEDVLPASAISIFVERAGDTKFVQDTLGQALKVKGQPDHTRASLYLDQIRVHAARIDKDNVAGFIKAMFEIGDDLDVLEDEERGFYSHGDNDLRLWFLIHAVLADRFNQEERSSILRDVIKPAQLQTLVTFAERCKSQHDKPSYDEPLVDAETAERLISYARERLLAVAKDGNLATHRRLFRLMWAWTRTGEGALDEVKAAVNALIDNDQFILNFASSAAGRSWSMSQGFDGMGDLVSHARLHVQRDAVSPLIDVPMFLSRLKAIGENTQSPDEATFVGAFMHAWENSDGGHLRAQSSEMAASDEAADTLEVASTEMLEDEIDDTVGVGSEDRPPSH